MAKDMTQGNLVRTLTEFSLPLIVSGVLQQLYNWADAFIVGNIEGEQALAAIGATGTISGMFLWALAGFTSGLTILSARLYGCGKREELRDILSTFIIVLGGIFLILGILGILLSGGILRLLQTPEEIFTLAVDYLQIILIGIPFLSIYNVYAAVIRGMGDSKVSFLSAMVSSIANVLLDVLFVGVFRWGVRGAAAATVIAQSAMTVFIVCYAVRKYEELRFWFGEGMLNRQMLKEGCTLSIPLTIQYIINSVGNLVLQNFMNGFGTQTVAAITTAYRVDTIILLPVINLSTGISTTVAQNIGAGNRKRAKKSLFVGLGMMTIVCICLILFVLSFGGKLIALFGVTQESALIGTRFFHSIARFYLIYGVAVSIRGFLEGIGDVSYTSICGILTLGIRIVLSYCLAAQYGNMVIAYAEGLSWCTLFVLCFIRFVGKQRRLEKSTL